MQGKTGGATRDDVDIFMTASMFQNEGLKHDGPSTFDPASPLCMADVPGNYNNVAFRPLAEKFHLKEFPACWQGVGLGGNGVYNGALYQEPAHWWWNDELFTDIFVSPEDQAKGVKVTDVIQPYFDKVRKELTDAILSHPSKDGVHYNHGLYDLLKPHLEAAGYNELPKNASELEKAGDRFYGVPTVNVHDGLRSGAAAWLEKFLDENGNVRPEFPNLEVMMHGETKCVVLDEDNKATGVSVKKFPTGPSEGLTFGLTPNSVYPDTQTISVTGSGKVILAAGALPTNRILYKSGVGPEVVRGKVYPRKKGPFQVNNPGIGVTVHEHVSTQLGFKYTGEEKPQPNNVHFDPADFNGNSEWLAKYAKERSGPYCQFGPVCATHYLADLDLLKGSPDTVHKDGLHDGYVTTELFYNPFGAGPHPPKTNLALNPYNGPGRFTVLAMLLRPEMRGIFRIGVNEDDEDDTAEYVQCYMNEVDLKDGAGNENPAYLNAEERAALGIKVDYGELARKDIATMTASVAEVLNITMQDPNIELTLGPGAPDIPTVYQAGPPGGTVKPIRDMDPKNIEDVQSWCTWFSDAFLVNGETLHTTRLEENHYHSTVPLARNLDVFGDDLGEMKGKYGLNPDNMEVYGTKGLCVVDASVFPKVVYCHPIGSVMAIAEYAADKISPLK